MRLNNQQSFLFLLHFIGLTATNLLMKLIPRVQKCTNAQAKFLDSPFADPASVGGLMNTGHIFLGLRFHLKVEKLFRAYGKPSWQEPDHMRGKDGT